MKLGGWLRLFIIVVLVNTGGVLAWGITNWPTLPQVSYSVESNGLLKVFSIESGQYYNFSKDVNISMAKDYIKHTENLTYVEYDQRKSLIGKLVILIALPPVLVVILWYVFTWVMAGFVGNRDDPVEGKVKLSEFAISDLILRMGVVTNLLRGMMYVLIFVLLVALAVNYMLFNLSSGAKQFVVGDAYSFEFTSKAALIDLYAFVVYHAQFIFGIVTAIVFAVWIYYANTIVRKLGAKNLRFSPGWSVGYYLIPFINLWRPYQAMREIWQASKNPTSWENEKRGAALPLWWTFFILNWVVANMAVSMTLKANEMVSLQIASVFQIIYNLTNIAAIVVALMLVKEIFQMQLGQAKKKAG